MDVVNKIELSTPVMVIGAAILLVGLIVLILCVRILSALRSGKETARSEDASSASSSTVTAEPAAHSEELVAAITAAVMAYAGPGKTMAVRSSRLASTSRPAWAQAGRREQMDSRF